MNTDGHGLGNADGTPMGANLGQGSFTAKGPRNRKRAEYRLSTTSDEPFGDPITRAWAREREARRWWSWPENDNAFGRVFQCVCCGKWRPNHDRREPRSEVCQHCVRE